jgi:TPR repeat protein
MRTILLAAASALAVTAGQPAFADGDPRPALWEFISVERYIQALAQVGAMALREQVDFTYSDISSDILSSTISMHGLKIYPDVPWPVDTPCVVSAERATIAGANPAQWDTMRVRLALYGATASPSCAMPELSQQLAATGTQQITLDRFEVELTYTVGPGRLLVSTQIGLADLAAVNVNLDFDYFAVKQHDVAAMLSSASVSVEDLGLWQKIKPILPPPMTDPNAVAQIVQGGLTDALNAAGPGPKRPQALPPEQQDFVNSMVREVRRFVTDQGTIAIDVQPAQPVYLNAEIAEDLPHLITVLRPKVSNGVGSRTPLINAAKLKAALIAPQMLDNAERRSIGMALLNGIGAPRSPSTGRTLLKPMAEAGDGQAALAIAQDLMSEDPAAAYRMVLKAAQNKTEGAGRLLDTLEQNLTTAEVLALQAESLPVPDEATFASISAMRHQAVAHLSGLGSQRSYRRALFWASMAAATGDASAARVISDIEDRMRFRGEAAAAAWRSEADAAGEEALEAWLSKGLAAKLSVRK